MAIDIEEYERKLREIMADEEAMHQVDMKIFTEVWNKHHPPEPKVKKEVKISKKRSEWDKFISGLTAFFNAL